MGRSGQLSRQWQRGGGITRGRKTNTNPLRKVTGYDETGNYEVLECGHKIHVREDFIGVTYPERRRCWRCARDAGSGSPRADEPKSANPPTGKPE